MDKDIILVSDDTEFTGQLLTALRNQNLEEKLALLRNEAELQHCLSRSGQMPYGVRMNMPKVILWNISRWTQEKVKLVEQITKTYADGAAFPAIVFLSLSDSLRAEKYLGGEIISVIKPIDIIHLDKIIDTIALWLGGLPTSVSKN